MALAPPNVKPGDTVCPRCKKDFLKSSWLIRHNERKTPCVSPGDTDVRGAERQSDGRYVCLGCEGSFANKFTVTRHLKKCEKSDSPGTVMNTPSQTINFSINLFGEEDTTHITAADALQIMKHVSPGGADRMKTAGQNAIVEAAELIFGDIEHPENITCFLPNKSDKIVMEHTKSGWKYTDYQRVAVPMATAALALLTNNQPLHEWKDGSRAEIDASQRMVSYLSKNEETFCASPPSGLAAVLYSNKSRLAMVLPRLPKFGEKMGAQNSNKRKGKVDTSISYVINVMKTPIPDDEKLYKKFLRQCAIIIDPRCKRPMVEQFENAVGKIRETVDNLTKLNYLESIDEPTQKKLRAICDWFVKNRSLVDWEKL